MNAIATPSSQLGASVAWFREARYGMMAHFGLYSLLAGEYRGRPSCSYAEWIQSYFRIPVAEYGALASCFNPVYFNADEWVCRARDAGMKYLVVTTKHHDGFALFRSKVDPFNVVDATPFRRDIVEELAAACARRGLRLGLYYSQDIDWHEPDGGGYRSDPRSCCGTAWDNNWDFPDASKKDYTRCYEAKILPQINEIMTQYGDIGLVWFDVPMTLDAAQSQRIFDLVKTRQPGCLVNSRLGNGVYDYVSLGDNEIPAEVPAPISGTFDPNGLEGFKPSPFGLYESACTLNDSWGFAYRDHRWKNAATIRANRERLNAWGVNYLVNVGPDGLGRIPGPSLDILAAAAP